MADPAPSSPAAPDRRFAGQVLHVVSRPLVARWAPMLRQTVWALAESGVPTALLTDDAELFATLDGTDVQCHHCDSLDGWRSWRLGGLLARRFQPPPAILHAWGTPAWWSLRRWARSQAVRILVHAFGVADVERAVRGGLRPGERLVVAAPRLAEPLAAHQRTAKVAWQAVSPAAALPQRTAGTPVADHILSVLCVSRLANLAGLTTLIDALAQLRAKRSEVQVVLVGDGPGLSAVWRHIRERKVNDCCVIIDEPKLWEKGLAGADVCVVPACQRELWLAPLLALGLGKLVIASRDQIGDWFVEGQTSWQFTPGSAVELAYLLTRAIEQPNAVRETCGQAAEYYRARHSVGDLVGRLIESYGTLAGTEVAGESPSA